MYNQQVIKTPYLMNLSCVRLLQLLYTSTNIVGRSLKTTEGRHPKIWKMLVGRKMLQFGTGITITITEGK